MATSLVPPPAPPAPASEQEQEHLIEQKLGVARRWVWWVELLTLLVAWVAGILGWLLVAALADHWIGLGTAGRIAFWMLLLAGSLYGLVVYGGPLVVRRINPLYAARTIEEARPSLKNSLINFLLLRRERAAVKEIIFQAVQQKAATDLVDVPVETTIDRSRLILAGYLLCGVMAAVAVYKILSPKDPFTSAARVLAPWAEIPRPSRVQIVHVEPGSAEVYRGQTVKVVATLHGVRPKDALRVLFSTVDGQIVDQPVELVHVVGDRYEAMLPPGAASIGSSEGMGQDATYRVVAGDAESASYRLTVVAAPRIVVRQLAYTFPAYTRKAPQVVAESGDIRALEGTRVTLLAQANQPIRSAWIEFDPGGGSPAQTLPLQAEGHEARGQFILQLRDDRLTPWHTTYQLRFIDQRGSRNQQPIVHRIEVLRDLPPEVEVLQPQASRVEVPEDAAVTLEIRGIDPDFGLARLYLEGQAAGRPPLTVDLLPPDADQPPQAVVPFNFQPRAHGLRAGDELKWVAVAEDHRVHPVSGRPEPNIARSPVQTLVVLPPQNATAAARDREAAGPPGHPPSKDAASQSANDAREPQPRGDRPQRAEPTPQEPNKPSPEQRQSSDAQSPSGSSKTSDSTSSAPQPNAQQQPSPSSSRDSGGQKGENDTTNGQQGADGGRQPRPTSDGQANEAAPQGSSGQSPSGNTRGAAGATPSSSQPGQGNEGQPSEQPAGRGPMGTSRDDQASTNRQTSGGSPGGAGDRHEGNSAPEQRDQNPLPPEGQVTRVEPGQPGRGKAHDGQAIEEFLKELQRRGLTIPPNQGSPPGDSSAGDAPASSETTASSKQPGAPGKGNPGTTATQPDGQGPKTTQRSKGHGQEGRPTSGPPDQPGVSEKKDGDTSNPAERQTPQDGTAGTEPLPSEDGSKKFDAKGSGSGKAGHEGAGTASREAQGSSGQGVRENMDVPKTPQPAEGKAEEGEPSPESNSKRQSDSRGGQSGDESGGGKAGAGQPSRQPGRDSAGSQTPSDEGAGAARELGSGEFGSQGGQGPAAGGKTGAQGQQAGQGSTSRPMGPSSGQQAGQAAGEAGQPESDRGSPQGEGQPGLPGASASDAPVGGSDGGRPRFQTPNRSGVDPEADRANLEYARRATEMVLQHLKDEAHRPDPELLERLGWTAEDLAEFVRRWEALSRAAEEAPAGRRELDEALRSLGLRDPALRKRSGGNVGDQQRDLRDAGNRSSPPPAYRELFDAFRKGAARAAGRP